MTKAAHLTLAFLFLGSSAAAAADLPARAYTQTLAPIAYNWTGWYLGINAGYGFGGTDTSNTSTTTDGALFGAPGNFPAGTVFRGPDRSFDLDGALGGGQFGYNFQTAQWLWGLELDFQGSGIKGSDSFATGGVTYDTDSKIDWFGTVRGRIGYAFGNVLPYITGGLAYAHSKTDVTVTFGPPFTASNSSVDLGYVVGGGVEAALWGNWTAKVEYLHMGLTANNDFAFAGTNGSTVHADADINLDIVRGGLNYHF